MAITMQYFLPLVPDSAPIVINVNQYDYDDPEYAGRLVFNLIYNGTAYDMTGATASIQGTKPDGKVFAYDATVNGSIIRAKLTQQMTAVYGRTVGNLIIEDADGNRIGTFAFWLEVQRSALDGSADPSETQLPVLIRLASVQAEAAQQSAEEAASYADDAAAYTGHPAYIGLNGDWYVFNTTTGLYEDSGVNAIGREGSMWYNGTAITGTSTTPTAYQTGIDTAHVNDMYLNIATGYVYVCTTAGDEDTALWIYLMALSGGGGLATWSIITGKPFNTIGSGLTVNGDDELIVDPALYYTKTEIDDIDKPLVKYGGTCTGSTLPALTADNENKFFLLTEDITTTSDFVVGAGHTMYADEHIAVINIGTESNPVYKYDDFGGYQSITLVNEGTASISGAAVQKLNVNGTKTEIDGTKYMESTGSANANTALTFTFSNAAITTDSVIDVYCSEWGTNPSSVSVSSGTCTVTFPARSTAYTNLKCRIYIR